MAGDKSRWTFAILLGILAAYFIAGLVAGLVNNANLEATKVKSSPIASQNE